MITVPFLGFPTDKLTDEIKGILRNGVLEVNNLLVIPMKISNITFEELGTPDNTEVIVEVEECLDINEWINYVRAFHMGSASQLQITRSEARNRFKIK